MDEQPTLSEVLRRFMNERAVSQERLARLSDVKEETIHHWLSGHVKRPYIVDNVLRVASALGLSRAQADRLLGAAGWPVISTLAIAAEDDRRVLLARWLVTVRNNLPAEMTSFVGRDAEVTDVAELLCDASVRLVTLTGPGGSGKTRLALRIAANLFDVFPDGVFFASLATFTDPDLVLYEVARMLGLRDIASGAARERLIDYLRSRRVLLVLDNLEQVIHAGPEIVTLLRSASGVKMLVTSRVPLHLSGEHEWSVRPLPVPVPGSRKAELERNSAVQLFVDRARAANAYFRLTRGNMRTVAELCARLDGLPLAIELAASRGGQESPTHLLARFSSLLDLTSGGPIDAPDRHRALRDTIAWSVNLLSPHERTLFARLGVFAGGWTEGAALAVCAGKDLSEQMAQAGLTALQHASLIERFNSNGSDRYQMLETIREYARERLTMSGEIDEIRRRHADHFLSLAHEKPLYVPESRPDDWYSRVDADIDNLRAAHNWASETGDHILLARLVVALWPFRHEYQQPAEGHRWISLALEHDATLPVELRAALRTAYCAHELALGMFSTGKLHAQEALALWQRLGDAHGQALVLQQLAWNAFTTGDTVQAVEISGRGLTQWRALNDPRGIARGLSDHALPLYTSGNFEAAIRYIDEAHALFTAPGNSVEDVNLGTARTLSDRGLLTLLRGDPAGAVPLLSGSIARINPSQSTLLLPATLFYYATALCLIGELDAAEEHYREALSIRERAGDVFGISMNLLGFAAVTHRRRQPERAAVLCGAVINLQRRVGIVLPPLARNLYDQEIGLIMAQISQDVFDARIADGEEMTISEAIAYARNT